MNDDDKLAILEKHIREIVLPMRIGLKEDGVAELAKRLLYSRNYSFNVHGVFIPTFATAEAIEQSGSPAAAHLFKQSADDEEPVAPTPQGEARYGGLTAEEFRKLPASKRLEIINAQQTRIQMESAAAEQVEIAAAVRAALPPRFHELSAEARLHIASTTETKIRAARKKASA
jgi:hypothetical protein